MQAINFSYCMDHLNYKYSQPMPNKCMYSEDLFIEVTPVQTNSAVLKQVA